MSRGFHLLPNSVPGYALPDGKCLPCSGLSGRAAISSYPCHGDQKVFQHVKIFLKKLPIYDCKRRSFACTASNSNRRNPDFSRQNRGFSRGRNRQNQERDKPDNFEDMDLLSSKNGPLLSLSSNPRYQTTAIPGQREKEIVELFRKVQAQLRERASIKEEKKIEAAQQGHGERGTVDSLLKLLRKHSVDQGKRRGGEEDFIHDQPERSHPFEDEQDSNFFESDNITSEEEVQETPPPPPTRPASSFRRRSPVPRVKYQPIYSAEEDVNSGSSLKSAGKKKKGVTVDEEPVSVDEREEFDDDPSESSDIDETEEIVETTTNENTDFNSLKLLELRALAKSRGIKGYSKLKKAELVELLSGE